MSEIKTKPTQVSVKEYLASISDEARRTDAEQLVALISKVTGQPPVMWGTSIVGFGSYHYKYASGREGDSMRIGLSARKEHAVIYGVIFYDFGTKLLEKLGKYTQGKGCLYIKKLADVDLATLEQMIANAWSQKHPSEA